MSEPVLVRVLDVAPLDVVTILERRGADLCATRYFALPVQRALDGAVRDHVLAGAAADLPPALATRLDGFRLRATLGALPGVPALVDAGVRRVKLGGLPPLAAAYGHAFVALQAHTGSPLPTAREQLSEDARRDVLVSIIRVVRALHDRGVAHGRLRAGAFAAAGANATLIDLEPLRASVEEHLAADRAAIASLATWLLGATAPGPVALHALWNDPLPPADGTVIVPDE